MAPSVPDAGRQAHLHRGLVDLRRLDALLLHEQAGILRKWADKYGITIKVQRFDYAPSLDAFVAKNIEACAMTNMEALDMPAASGVPTTAVLIGDYSNGNDALLVRNGLQMKDLPGKKMLLVQKTVSEYLLRPRHDSRTACGITSSRCDWSILRIPISPRRF